MADAKREISGFFVSAEKFASHVASLARHDCATTQLRLFHNEPHHTAAVVDALSRNTSVTSLDIFELDPLSANSLAAVLSASPRLEILAVHHPHGQEAVGNLCRGIASSCTLTSLHLSHLDPHGVASLASGLLSWSSPRPHPDTCGPGSMSGSEATVTAPETNPGALAPIPRPRLRRLRLEKCLFTPNTAGALAKALGRQAGALEQLEIVDSELGDAAAEALLGPPESGAQLLGTGSALGSLDLSSCHVGLRGAAQLGQLLLSSPSLHTLNLGNNKAIGCEGARALAAGLAKNRALLRLDLKACGISTKGIEALAAALRPRTNSQVLAAGTGGGGSPGCGGGPPLQQLTLSFNAAGAAGLAALLWTLSEPTACGLRNLQLDHNHVRGLELTEALRSPPQETEAQPPTEVTELPRVAAPLEQLSLAGNALYDTGVTVLSACLAGAPCLGLLDLRENGISDAGVAALLPLIAPRGSGCRSGGSCGGALQAAECTSSDAVVAAAAAAVAAPSSSLEGLLLDGNRLHNAGAQVLLEAITASPKLWRFSAEGNKLTDPALRMALTQLSQQRAARHSQLVVLGRYYSSSSSSSSDDGTGTGNGNGNGNGGGGGRRGNAGGGGDSRRGHEATSPMDVDVTATTAVAAAHPPRQGTTEGCRGAQQQQQQQHQQHKHRLDDVDTPATNGAFGVGYGEEGDERQPLRNVAARGANGASLPTGGGSGDGDGFTRAGPATSTLSVQQQQQQQQQPPPSGRQFASQAWSWNLPSGGEACPVTGHNPCGVAVPGSHGRCPGGGSPVYSGSSSSGGDMVMLGSDGAAAASRFLAAPPGTGTAAATATGSCDGGGGCIPAFCSSPPAAAMCYVMAITGVGGAASVSVSKRVGAVDESDPSTPGPIAAAYATATAACAADAATATAASVAAKIPQQVLPACRRPRYKPLTPEQQRLFEDF